MTGLFGDPVKRKGVVADKVGRKKYKLWIEYFFLKCFYSLFFGGQMVEMIFQFADFALKRCPEQGKIQVMEQHFHVSHSTNLVRCKTLSTNIKKTK